jgi:peptidoglycan hydrolase CwlO-like protein
MNWIKRLFSSKKVKDLEKEIESLKTEVDKRQEAINKTNAYWKKKMNELYRKQKL